MKGNDKVTAIQKSLESLAGKAGYILTQITKEHQSQIEDLNIFQLQKGIDGEGNRIEPPYADLTVAIKQAQGKRYDVVTLEDTGAFYKGIGIKIMNEGFEFFDTDRKTDSLMIKYGKDILGLNSDSISYSREYIYKPEFIYWIRRLQNLKKK